MLEGPVCGPAVVVPPDHVTFGVGSRFIDSDVDPTGTVRLHLDATQNPLLVGTQVGVVQPRVVGRAGEPGHQGGPHCWSVPLYTVTVVSVPLTWPEVAAAAVPTPIPHSAAAASTTPAVLAKMFMVMAPTVSAYWPRGCLPDSKHSGRPHAGAPPSTSRCTGGRPYPLIDGLSVPRRVMPSRGPVHAAANMKAFRTVVTLTTNRRGGAARHGEGAFGESGAVGRAGWAAYSL